MIRRILGLASIVVVAVSGSRGQQPVFSTKAEAVLVDVQVTARGKPVAGLTARDFEVTDNGVRQSVEAVTGGPAGDAVPLDLALVFDASETMTSNLEVLAAAARSLLHGLRPRDRVALITFSDRTELVCPLTSDSASVATALESVRANGRTSIFDALYAAMMLRPASTSRAAILVFSDGRDNASWLDQTAVSKVARESDVVVYGVGLDDSVRKDLEGIVEDTGGEMLTAESVKELTAAFLRLLGQMQLRYVLAYSPRGVERAGWHALDVRLTGGQRGREIRARRGYYVPPPVR